MASQAVETNNKPLDPANFSHYHTYNFSIDPFKPLLAELENPSLVRSPEGITLGLRTRWKNMYESALETLERNLTCPKCGKKPDEDGVNHKANMSGDTNWAYYLRLHKDREAKLLDAEAMKKARFDFTCLEELYLGYDAGSEFKGLDGLRNDLKGVRERTRARFEGERKEQAEKAQATKDNPGAPASGSEDSSTNPLYRCYVLTTKAFESLRKQGKKATQETKISEKWKQMCGIVWQSWKTNLICPECSYFPGKEPASEKHTYSSVVQLRVERLEKDLGTELPWKLDEVDMDDFRKRLYAAEDLYLKENKWFVLTRTCHELPSTVTHSQLLCPN